MRKWTTFVLGVTLAVSLSACGNNEAAEKSTNAAEASATAAPAPEATEQAAAEQTANEGTPTVEELIQKTADASQGLKSFAMESQISQKMSMTQGETTQDQNVEMTMKSEYMKDPLQMHQLIQINLAGQGEQKMEQYITDAGSFSLVNGQWIKMPAEMTEQVMSAMQQSASPEKQLEQFKSITEFTKVTEDGEDYVLTAEVSGDNVKELAKSYMNQSGSADPQMTALMDQMDIKSMTIVYGVNQKTYLPTRTDVDMVMDMTADSQKISIDMKMKNEIGQHNEIKAIEVPKEALQAKEIQTPSATAAVK
ncbi:MULTISPECIES: DUF6612 family protein [Paenibacillus]|uniref:DUF4412 domain-containing protein n=1 Tax=Paenibacillus borealis TaxID=160799 RepID=A0ABX3HF30_PAEBO|nr:DUF6612 family protein [Paenibacillus borealis]OMD49127.1 hypothetical protein BSK56_09875 [Paenibacillus borealis]